MLHKIRSFAISCNILFNDSHLFRHYSNYGSTIHIYFSSIQHMVQTCTYISMLFKLWFNIHIYFAFIQIRVHKLTIILNLRMVQQFTICLLQTTVHKVTVFRVLSKRGSTMYIYFYFIQIKKSKVDWACADD